ncbi:ribonuclease P protein component [Chloroflexota bacterium]
MAEVEYIKKKQQFNLVYENGKLARGSLLFIKTMPNGLDFSRYGSIVSKRIGKAVIRNKVKRRLREIMRQVIFKPGWDIVIYTRPAIAVAKYDDLRNMILSLLSKAHLLVERYERACPGAD